MIAINADIKAALSVLAGDTDRLEDRPVPVWDPARVAFLAELSKRLIAHQDTRALPDVMSFAYWIRKANLAALQERTTSPGQIRVGLGLVFHICPSNVPVNFAFSMAFGLLSGNSCVLRLPSAETETTDLLTGVINGMLAEPAYADMKKALLLLRYEHNDEVTGFWMSKADGRIVWGGNETVQHMRSFTVPPRSREIAFPDRYSLCTLKADAILELNGKDLEAFCRQLYNDIYLMDQAACSSPQLIAWTGAEDNIRAARDKLWPALEDYSLTRYDIAPIQVMDKLVDTCNVAIENSNVTEIHRTSPVLYRYQLEKLAPEQEDCRGYSGTLYEVALPALDDLAAIVDESYQTLTYFGYDQDELITFIGTNGLRGIDRAVPVGKALDMDIVWDGYDMISTLSRIVEVS